jgi:hypothetical protein
MKRFNLWASDSLYLLALSGVLLIPLPLHLFHNSLADSLFGGIIRQIASFFPSFGIVDPAISSDSASLYLLMFLLVLSSMLLAGILASVNGWALRRERILPLVRKILVYYLLLMLLKYGFDKVFREQFYTPEPNILYTPLGQLDSDMLFWSTLGTSYTYSLLTGLLEIFAAVCLAFSKTRVLGLLTALTIMTHVLVINLGFDISVKLFSAFLLFIILLLLSPQLKRLYHFLVLNELQGLKPEGLTYAVFYHPFLRISFKTLLLGVFLLEALQPFITKGCKNHDMAGKPYLHGAYEVFEVSRGKDSVDIHETPVRRFFIHRDGFMIFQDWNDGMSDYRLQLFPGNTEMILTDYALRQSRLDYQWHAQERVMTLSMYPKDSASYTYKARTLDWESLPALRRQFHWMVDDVK